MADNKKAEKAPEPAKEPELTVEEQCEAVRVEAKRRAAALRNGEKIDA